MVKCGIPQGTVLGPILFTLYLNDLLTLKTTGTSISYADDTVVIYNDPDWEHLSTKVIEDLSRIKQWMDQNLLTMNAKKNNFYSFCFI